MSFDQKWWSVTSRKKQGVDDEEQNVRVFNNGFYIENFELEEFDSQERDRFLHSLKENQIPDALSKSPHYPGDHLDYFFTIEKDQLGTSLAWRNYESEEVELKEYDPEWPNLYKKEQENIVNNLPIDEHLCRDDQPLFLEMEHVGSTSVEEMYAKPIIDMLIIQGPMRDGGRIDQVCKTLLDMGYSRKNEGDNSFNFHRIFLKKGFIVHIIRDNCGDGYKEKNLIIFRQYLRAHPDARSAYSQHKKSLIANKRHLTIEQYATRKDRFVNELFKKATEWYRQNENYVHIGDFDEVKSQWSCCKASRDERNRVKETHPPGGPSSIGCCQPGLQKDSYHPGRFLSVEYNFVTGWWTCCSQGHHSDGCVKIRLLSNGDALLKDCNRWGTGNVCRWVKSLKDINKDYSDDFLKHGINGHVLLTSVDDVILQELGVSTILHRRLFLKAIEELKDNP